MFRGRYVVFSTTVCIVLGMCTHVQVFWEACRVLSVLIK